MARAWYYYNGPVGSIPEGTVGNYSLATFPISNCAGGPGLCAVYLVSNGAQPYAPSNRVKSYFGIAKTNQSHYPNSGGQKPYVYTRATTAP